MSARHDHAGQEPDLAELKQSLTRLVEEFRGLMTARRDAGCPSLAARREEDVAADLTAAAADIARAAHCREVRDACDGRGYMDSTTRRVMRSARLTSAAAVIGLGIIGL